MMKKAFKGVRTIPVHKRIIVVLAKYLAIPAAMVFMFYLGKYGGHPTLVMPTYEGTGLGSNLISLIGFLNHCDKGKLRSFQVDFSEGVYSQEELESNWWNYFFESIERDSMMAKMARYLKLSRYKKIGYQEMLLFCHHVEFYMKRKRASKLIKKYIHLKPEIALEIETFKNTHFQDSEMIGLHYRGTDKSIEAPPVSFEEVFRAVSQILEKKGRNTKIFVATDTQKFLDFIEEKFPGQVVKTDAMRSQDERPLHLVDHRSAAPNHLYLQGKEAIIDAWLLSQTDFLIHTNSNLSFFSRLLNPDLPYVELNDRHPEAKVFR